MEKKGGFTLIELLVVIGIVALLISVIIPTLGKAKESPKCVICMSNLRQLGMGMQIYTSLNDDNTMALKHNGDNYWFHEIAPHLGDWDYKENPQSNLEGVMKIAFCPKTKLRKDLPYPYIYGSIAHSWRCFNAEGGYGLNLWFLPKGVYEGDFTETYYWHKYSQASSDVPVFSDAVWVGAWPDGNDEVPDDIQGGGYGTPMFPHQMGYFMGRVCINRHQYAVNVSFADGHCETVKLEKLWRLRWHQDNNPGNEIEIPPGWYNSQ